MVLKVRRGQAQEYRQNNKEKIRRYYYRLNNSILTSTWLNKSDSRSTTFYKMVTQIDFILIQKADNRCNI